ncbi:MbtH family protein [Streptomyces californicus]|uniref:MbtH family protein n=1 Tax=Streptomyces californicus TaxID=67351 RepID=UPI0037884B41
MTDDRVYQVVVNHEEQYSIWDSEMNIPAGWSHAGVSGSREECLAYIDRTWTDITPLSVRTKYSQTTF